MSYETITCERQDRVRLVRLNRPRRRNALSGQMVRELTDLVRQVEADEGIGALVITGDAQAFCSGQDLKETPPPTYVLEINDLFNRLEALPQPTIAAIDGWCLAGGLELALACDIRVAAETARIGDWHVKINSIGGAGATVRLVRQLGLARAKELVFTGEALSGADACRIGLVNRLHPAGEHLKAGLALAGQIAAMNSVTLRHAKLSMNAAADLELHQALQFSLSCQERVQRLLRDEFAGGAFQTTDGTGKEA